MERGFWEAAGDAGHYGARFHDDGVMLLPHLPHPMDKGAVLAAVARAAPWTRFAFDEVSVSSPAPGLAVLAYRAQAERPGLDTPYRALVGSVYLRGDGGWMLFSHQQTPLEPA
nr:nuclear transport factor 2 family protein [Lysobacter chinensis]